MTLGEVSRRAGISISAVRRVEMGERVSFDALIRTGLAVGLKPEIEFEGRLRQQRAVDPVHAAMGEVEARRLTSFRRPVLLDEPYQHYQFAGRADLIAYELEARALLHIENRTRFPNVQEFAGAWNSKRAYMPGQLAMRLRVSGGWKTIDHVVVALWSAEAIHAVRLREQSFRSICPDAPDGFAAWWNGMLPSPGIRTTMVLFDPTPGTRRTRRAWVGLDAIGTVDPRYKAYPDAVDALRRAGLA